MTGVAVMAGMTGVGMMISGSEIGTMTGGNEIDMMIEETKEEDPDLHLEEKGLEAMIEGGRLLEILGYSKVEIKI